MTYRVTSDQGRMVYFTRSERNLKAYVRALIRRGVSYSIEES